MDDDDTQPSGWMDVDAMCKAFNLSPDDPLFTARRECPTASCMYGSVRLPLFLPGCFLVFLLG